MTSYDFPGKGKVAVLRTRPESVIDDVGHVMQMAGCAEALRESNETILAIDVSEQTWYPGASTTPWQLEGVIRRLQADGYRRLIAAPGANAGVDTEAGQRNNKLSYVLNRYGVERAQLDQREVASVIYEPREEMLVLHDLFPEGITIPRFLIGKNAVRLPTLKTDPLTLIAGAMRNALGGMLSDQRRWVADTLHAALVDLLTIQREIHRGLFAVMDGTFAGAGFGAGASIPTETDLVLASADLVALDAISAHLQGIEPMSLDFIRLATERGLGVGNPREIKIVGYDVFAHDRMGARAIGAPTSTRLLSGPLAPVASVAANFYRDVFWNPLVGRRRVNAALGTRWGQVFKSYDDGRVVLPGPEAGTTAVAAAGLAVAAGAVVLGRNLRK